MGLACGGSCAVGCALSESMRVCVHVANNIECPGSLLVLDLRVVYLMAGDELLGGYD